MGRHLGELRYEPTTKRIRAKVGDETIITAIGRWSTSVPMCVRTTEGEPVELRGPPVISAWRASGRATRTCRATDTDSNDPQVLRCRSD